MNSFEYVLRAETPKFIPVADKPLKLGGKIEYLTVDEFQKRLGCIYNDGISLDRTAKISPFCESVTGYVPASQLKIQVEKVLKTAPDNMVICNMGKFGHGVFASKDIPKDTVVAIYAGTITKGDKISDEGDQALGYYGTNMLFSTKHHRGISSFMQHLPEEPKFKDVKTFSQMLKMFGQDDSEDNLKLNFEFYSTEFLSNKIREIIVTQNIRREFLNYKNIPVAAMVTNKEIKSGDQLGFNYGFLYWLSRTVVPVFFDINGNELSHKVYKKTFGRLNFANFSYTGEYKPLIDSINQGRASVIVMGDDKKPHDVPFGDLLSKLLRVNACRVEINPDLFKAQETGL